MTKLKYLWHTAVIMSSTKKLTVQNVKDQFKLWQLHPECPKCKSSIQGMLFVSVRDLVSSDIDWYQHNRNLSLICCECKNQILDTHVFYCDNTYTTLHPKQNFHICINCGVSRWKDNKRINGKIIK